MRFGWVFGLLHLGLRLELSMDEWIFRITLHVSDVDGNRCTSFALRGRLDMRKTPLLDKGELPMY